MIRKECLQHSNVNYNVRKDWRCTIVPNYTQNIVIFSVTIFVWVPNNGELLATLSLIERRVNQYSSPSTNREVNQFHFDVKSGLANARLIRIRRRHSQQLGHEISSCHKTMFAVSFNSLLLSISLLFGSYLSVRSGFRCSSSFYPCSVVIRNRILITLFSTRKRQGEGSKYRWRGPTLQLSYIHT